jgi:hypothetical protein
MLETEAAQPRRQGPSPSQFILLLLALLFLHFSFYMPLIFLQLVVKFCSLSKLFSVSLCKLFSMYFLLLNCLLHVGFAYFARAPKNCTTMVLLALLQIKDSAMLFVLLLNYKGLTEALSLTSEKLIVDLKVVKLKAQLFGVFR